MMRLKARDPRWRERLDRRRKRGLRDQARVLDGARLILEDVRKNGDRAVLRYTLKFDGVRLKAADLRVPADEIAGAAAGCDRAGLAALRLAARRIERFHRRQVRKGWSIGGRGERLGQRVTPLARVGLYVPGGRAAYPSTVLMTALPARIAGVAERVMCTPPGPDGEVSPWVLAAAGLAGVTEVYKVGGVQAIGALAYGTATIRPVDKVVGPGNAHVAAAKRWVFGEVGIDQIAGPSELLVVADDSARPDWVAADLLAQAEHDPDAWVGLVAVGSGARSRNLADRVVEALNGRLRNLERRRIAAAAWKRNGLVVEAAEMETAAGVAAAIRPALLRGGRVRGGLFARGGGGLRGRAESRPADGRRRAVRLAPGRGRFCAAHRRRFDEPGRPGGCGRCGHDPRESGGAGRARRIDRGAAFPKGGGTGREAVTPGPPRAPGEEDTVDFDIVLSIPFF